MFDLTTIQLTNLIVDLTNKERQATSPDKIRRASQSIAKVAQERNQTWVETLENVAKEAAAGL